MHGVSSKAGRTGSVQQFASCNIHDMKWIRSLILQLILGLAEELCWKGHGRSVRGSGWAGFGGCESRGFGCLGMLRIGAVTVLWAFTVSLQERWAVAVVRLRCLSSGLMCRHPRLFCL